MRVEFWQINDRLHLLVAFGSGERGRACFRQSSAWCRWRFRGRSLGIEGAHDAALQESGGQTLDISSSLRGLPLLKGRPGDERLRLSQTKARLVDMRRAALL